MHETTCSSPSIGNGFLSERIPYAGLCKVATIKIILSQSFNSNEVWKMKTVPRNTHAHMLTQSTREDYKELTFQDFFKDWIENLNIR